MENLTQRIPRLLILLSLSGVCALSIVASKAQAQTYVLGTASYPAPGLSNVSPPTGNTPMLTADLNGDGIPDIAILGTSSGVQVASIFLGRPDGTFAPGVDYPVPATGLTVGDFNGDGKLDLVVVNDTYPMGASILYGNGDGTFESPVALSQNVDFGYSTVASADLNADGKLDLVFLSQNFGSGATMAVLLGNGDGTFQSPVTYPVPVAPYLAVGDFNDDGKPDIAISGPLYGQASEVSVLINNGDGTFKNPVNYSVSGVVQGLVTTDLNNDGKLDLVVPSGGYTASVSVLLGIGDGTFASPIVYSSNLLSLYATSVAVADYNGDGKLDLALTDSVGSTNAVAILLGNGDGTFQNPPLLYSAGLLPGAVVALDVNGDGKPDLAVAGGYGVLSYFSVTVLLNRGDGSFPNPSAYPVLKYPWSAVVGDFNGDGKPDIAAMSDLPNSNGQYIGGAVSVLLGNGDGTFQPRKDSTTTNIPSVMATGDFNGDGKLDLVVAESTQFSTLLATWIGNGDGTFQTNISQAISNFARSLTVGDFNRDGKLDVAATIDYRGGVAVFLGKGDGSFAAPVPYPTGASTQYPGYNVITADFNGDGKLDLAVTTDQGISILLGNGDGTFQPYSSILPGETLLAVADFNGDGKPDLLISTGNDIISCALGNGNGTFQQAPGYQIPPGILSTGSPTVGDFNSDGKLDVAFTSQSTNVITILFGDGKGSFTGHIEYSTAQVPALVAADFNGDGALDLAMTDVTNQAVSVMLNSPIAAFAPRGLTFALQEVGTVSPEHSVTLTNPGSAPLAITNITVTGDFTQSNDCGSSLGIGKNCQVNVTFSPSAAGTRTGMLYFTDSASVLAQTLPLSGTGTLSARSISPTALAFRSQQVGTTSPSQTLTLSNTGTAPLTISSIAASGDFSQMNSCGSSLAAGANCTITATFTPTATGPRKGSIAITDNAEGSPQTVIVTGVGAAAMLSPASLTFPSQNTGTSSAPQTVTLTNTSNSTMNIWQMAITGANASDFSKTTTCGGTLAGGANCTINVVFTPSGAGARAATMLVSNDGGGSPQAVMLTGTGTLAPSGKLSPRAVFFGTQPVGTAAPAQAVVLTNSGGTTLEIGNITLSGAAREDFAETSDCGAGLAPGRSCTLRISFTPRARGVRTTVILIGGTVKGSSNALQVSGEGGPPKTLNRRPLRVFDRSSRP